MRPPPLLPLSTPLPLRPLQGILPPIMRLINPLLFFLLLLLCHAAPLQAGEPPAGLPSSVEEVGFSARLGPVPEAIRKKMIPATWREGCPVPVEKLAYVELPYWGFDEAVHQGALIVHQDVALEVIDIFAELFEARFPMESVRIIEEFNGDDMASMQANNTSAFNCRTISGTSRLSRHSWGLAIDINPLLNPYVKGKRVSPPEGKPHADPETRDRRPQPGYVLEGELCHQSFVSRGWEWGGAWTDRKDYQHFEKHLNNAN
jgi:hypothetical protein